MLPVRSISTAEYDRNGKQKRVPKKMICKYGILCIKKYCVVSENYIVDRDFNSFRKAKQFLKENKKLKGIMLFWFYK